MFRLFSDFFNFLFQLKTGCPQDTDPYYAPKWGLFFSLSAESQGGLLPTFPTFAVSKAFVFNPPFEAHTILHSVINCAPGVSTYIPEILACPSPTCTTGSPPPLLSLLSFSFLVASTLKYENPSKTLSSQFPNILLDMDTSLLHFSHTPLPWSWLSLYHY